MALFKRSPGPEAVSEFARHAPWVTRFVVDGVAVGGAYDAPNDGRVQQFFSAFADARRILELGSLEGGHTLALARYPGVERVVGIEGRAANVARARLVKHCFGLANAEFVLGDLEQLELRSLGDFDAIFCVGVLYHLPRPWQLLERMATVSRNVFVWTHYALRAEAATGDYVGRWFRERGLRDPLSGLSRKSFWPILPDLERMVAAAGLGPMTILDTDPKHPAGPCVTFTTRAVQ